MDDARDLVNRLYAVLKSYGEHIAAFFEIMDKIRCTEAWRVEGCDSLADFCRCRVMPRIPKTARPLLVQQFRELGWTLRETAAAVGASPATVLRDERAAGATGVSDETRSGPVGPLDDDGVPAGRDMPPPPPSAPRDWQAEYDEGLPRMLREMLDSSGDLVNATDEAVGESYREEGVKVRLTDDMLSMIDATRANMAKVVGWLDEFTRIATRI